MKLQHLTFPEPSFQRLRRNFPNSSKEFMPANGICFNKKNPPSNLRWVFGRFMGTRKWCGLVLLFLGAVAAGWPSDPTLGKRCGIRICWDFGWLFEVLPKNELVMSYKSTFDKLQNSKMNFEDGRFIEVQNGTRCFRSSDF